MYLSRAESGVVCLGCTVQKGKVEDGIVHISKKARTLSAEEPSGHNYSNRYQCDSKGDLGMKPNSDSIYNISLNCPAVVLKLCLAIWYMSRYYLVLRCMNKRLCCGPGPNVFRNPCDGNTPCFDFVDPSSEVCCVCKSRNRGCESCNAQRPVVLHFSSKHIEVSLDSFICQLEGGSELVMDMFDAIIRSLRQADDIMHSGKLCPRWRHFFESDFVVSILAGAFDPSDCNVLDHLVGSHIGYNVSSCKMMIFPFILGHRWVCYAWNLELNRISVFDLSLTQSSPPHIELLHIHLVEILKQAVKAVMEVAYSCWIYDWEAATVDFICLPHETFNGANRSGFLVAHFCNKYGGTVSSLLDSNIFVAEKDRCLALDAIKLVDNYGFIPRCLL